MKKLINIIFIFIPVALVWAQTPFTMRPWKLQNGNTIEASAEFEMRDDNQRVYVWVPGEDKKMEKTHFIAYNNLSQEDQAAIQAANQGSLAESQMSEMKKEISLLKKQNSELTQQVILLQSIIDRSDNTRNKDSTETSVGGFFRILAGISVALSLLYFGFTKAGRARLPKLARSLGRFIGK